MFLEATGKDGQDRPFGLGMAEEDDTFAGSLVGEHFMVLEFAGDDAIVGVAGLI